MKILNRKRVMSFLLALAMFASLIPGDAFKLIATAVDTDTTTDTTSQETYVDKQAVFDWWSSFDIAGESYGKPNLTDIATVSYDELAVSDIVVQIVDRYYDTENGELWYRVSTDNLPEGHLLVDNPWVLYTTDSDVEEGLDPYLYLYDADKTIRFVTSEIITYQTDEDGNVVNDDSGNPVVLERHINYYVFAGPSALADATITVTPTEDYTVSALAYTEPTFHTTFSEAFAISITKADGTAWSDSNGDVSIRYETAQFDGDTYSGDVYYGAAFLYTGDSVYTAEVTDRLYDISDAVYTNSGTSTLVFEHMPADFTIIDAEGYYEDTTKTNVNFYDNTLSASKTVTTLPASEKVLYSFTQVTYKTVESTSEDGTVSTDIVVDKEMPYYWIEAEDKYCYVSQNDIALNFKDAIMLEDESTGITVTGLIPEGVTLTVETAYFDSVPSFVDMSFLYGHNIIMAYDITLLNADGTGWQPSTNGAKVNVQIPDVWDTDWGCYARVDVYHLNDDDTLKETFSTTSDTVTCLDGGYISFSASSFSTYIVNSGNTSTITIATDDNDQHAETHKGHILYIAPTGNALITISGVDTPDLPTRLYDTSNGAISIASEGANQRITAISANPGESCIFKWTWISGSTEYTAEVLIVVIDPDDYDTYSSYHSTIVQHIQLNVEQVAVVIDGETVDTLTDVGMGFSSSTSGTLRRVEDHDSSVGYYYVYEYTVPAGTYTGQTSTFTASVTLRIDETYDYVDASGNAIDISTLDFIISDVLLVAGTSSGEQDQITFIGTFPSGVYRSDGAGAIQYLLSVNTMYYGSNETYFGDNLSFSTNINYWDEDNVCPGKNSSTSNPSGQGGIDVAEFSMGYTINGTTYYVVYSDLTKNIVGDVLEDEALANQTKQFTYTIYRRLKNPEEGATNAWEEFDSLSVIGDFTDDGNGISTTTVTLGTEASKYDPVNLDNYEFMIVESGNNITGYSCDVAYGTSGGIFEFDTLGTYQEATAYTYTSSGIYNSRTHNYQTIIYAFTDGSYKITTTISRSSGNGTTYIYETLLNSDKEEISTILTTSNSNVGGTQTSTSDSTWDTHKSNMASGAETVVENNWDFTTGVAVTPVTISVGTVVYSAQLSCTNTYTKIDNRLHVSKVVNGAGAPASEQFTIIVESTALEDGESYNYTIGDDTTVNTVTAADGKLTLTLTKGQTFKLDVPAGTYTIYEQAAATLGFTYDSTTYTRVITEEAGAAVTITNIYSADKTIGSLIISKEVVSSNSSVQKPTGADRAEFTFTVTFANVGDVTSFEYAIYEASGAIAGTGTITGTSGTITLKDGQYALFDALKDGVTYTVTEATPPADYELKSSSGTSGTIVAQGEQTAAFVNEHKVVTIYYVVVTPDYGNIGLGNTAGTDDSLSETLAVSTGVAQGATAAPVSDLYRFVGWYRDAACTNLITTDATYGPTKDANSLWVDGTTYYAKFEYNLTSLTIQKATTDEEGEAADFSNVDKNQTFIFDIFDSEGNLIVTVTVHGNSSVKVYGLTVGQQYTIVERTAWSWRYSFKKWEHDVNKNDTAATDDTETASGTTNDATITLGLDGTITFTNSRNVDQWLDGDAWCDNLFNEDEN